MRRYPVIAIAMLVTVVSGCQDSILGAPDAARQPSAARPAPSTTATEEMVEWQGNVLAFYDDSGVHHQLVVSEDWAGRAAHVDVYRNGAREAIFDYTYDSSGLMTQQVLPASNLQGWVHADAADNYLADNYPYGNQYSYPCDPSMGYECPLTSPPPFNCEAENRDLILAAIYAFVDMGAIVLDSYKSRIPRSAAIRVPAAIALFNYQFYRVDQCLKGVNSA